MGDDESNGGEKAPGWRGEERRNGNGWTIWKEIYGTAVAIAPFAIMFFVWVSSIDRQGMENKLEIAHLRESRGEVLIVVTRISGQISELQQAVARLSK